MKIFAIGDLHLSFNENIDKPMSIFGSGWDNYEARLKTAWEERITDEDVVILPGDLSWSLKLEEAIDDLNWIHALPGKKILLKGNHDLWWSKINYINTLYDDMTFLQNTCYYIEEADIAICGSRGWVVPGSDEFKEHDMKIYKRELGRLESSLNEAKRLGAGRIIVALHYPPADAIHTTSGFTELMSKYNVTNCLYGHLHGMAAFGKAIKNTHDGIEYKLVSLDYLGAIPKLIAEV